MLLKIFQHPLCPSLSRPRISLAFLGFSECQRKYRRVHNAPFWLQRDRSNRAFSTVLSLRPLKNLVYILAPLVPACFFTPPPPIFSSVSFRYSHYVSLLPLRSPSQPFLLSFFPIFFAKQHDLLIALLSRSRYPPRPFHPIFRSSCAVSVSPTFLLLASAFRHFLLSPFPLSPLSAWRVISRKPWYFVGHGVQSHEGPDEA